VRDLLVLSAVGVFWLALALALTWWVSHPERVAAAPTAYCSEYWAPRQGELQPHLECWTASGGLFTAQGAVVVSNSP